MSFASLLSPKPYEIFGKLLIDGGDKSQGKPSFRLKTLDDKSDWFFIWATIFDDKGMLDVRLSKASADLDADGNSGGVLFKEWNDLGGIKFPSRREFVKGMKEAIERSAVAENVELSGGINEPLFKVSND